MSRIVKITPHVKGLSNILSNYFPSKNNHIYSSSVIWSGFYLHIFSYFLGSSSITTCSWMLFSLPSPINWSSFHSNCSSTCILSFFMDTMKCWERKGCVTNQIYQLKMLHCYVITCREGSQQSSAWEANIPTGNKVHIRHNSQCHVFDPPPFSFQSILWCQ